MDLINFKLDYSQYNNNKVTILFYIVIQTLMSNMVQIQTLMSNMVQIQTLMSLRGNSIS
jgi:hypothetical protein